MGKLGECRSTFGRLSTTQATVDLPAYDATPAKIDVSGDLIVAVAVWFDEEIYWTYAESDASGLTRIASDDTRCKMYSDGYIQFPTVGNSGAIYVRRVSGAAITDGLTYTLIEGD